MNYINFLSFLPLVKCFISLHWFMIEIPLHDDYCVGMRLWGKRRSCQFAGTHQHWMQTIHGTWKTQLWQCAGWRRFVNRFQGLPSQKSICCKESIAFPLIWTRVLMWSLTFGRWASVLWRLVMAFSHMISKNGRHPLTRWNRLAGFSGRGMHSTQCWL